MKKVKVLIVILSISLFSFITGCIVTVYTQSLTQVQAEEPIVNKINEDELTRLIVEFKKEKGLTEPVNDNNLCFIAESRIGQVSRNWSHSGFETNSPRYGGFWTFSLTSLNHINENLAKNWLSAPAVLQAWKESKIHLNILMKNDPFMCTRCDNINGVNYCVYISGSL